ncbi:MAG: MBL fold metallo-hydrolase [Clostridiales bacterium]|nr:MBL fold metallo-hydrolase [Clostridiales bacterium]
MARFCSLFSSSRGNCTYVGNQEEGVLIDAGCNAKQIRLALQEQGIDLATVKAVFVTHEHTDHISGLRVLCSGANIPVFASEGTYRALEERGHLNGKFFSYVMQGRVAVGDMEIVPFQTSHDCAQSYGYRVETRDGRRISVLTDTGYVTEESRRAVLGSDLVLLESNHDVEMLKTGSYPYILKRRILSDTGHLSNEACGEFARELVQSGTTRLVLGHLSQENNLPQLAFESTSAALRGLGAEVNRDYLLDVARVRGSKGMVVL